MQRCRSSMSGMSRSNVAADDAIPCTSTTTGPSPTSFATCRRGGLGLRMRSRSGMRSRNPRCSPELGGGRRRVGGLLVAVAQVGHELLDVAGLVLCEVGDIAGLVLCEVRDV